MIDTVISLVMVALTCALQLQLQTLLSMMEERESIEYLSASWSGGLCYLVPETVRFVGKKKKPNNKTTPKLYLGMKYCSLTV